VFVTLVIKYALHMYHNVMWPVQLYNIIPHYAINGMIMDKKVYHNVMWPIQLYNTIPHYPTNGIIIDKKVTSHIMCVWIFSTNLSETFLITIKNERDMIINVY